MHACPSAMSGLTTSARHTHDTASLHSFYSYICPHAPITLSLKQDELMEDQCLRAQDPSASRSGPLCDCYD